MHADFPLEVCTLMKFFPILRIIRTTFRWWYALIKGMICSITEMAFRWYLADFSPGTGRIDSMVRDLSGLYSLCAINSIFFLDMGNKPRPPLAFGISQKCVVCRAATSANYLNYKVQMVSSIIQLYWNRNRQNSYLWQKGWLFLLLIIVYVVFLFTIVRIPPSRVYFNIFQIFQ